MHDTEHVTVQNTETLTVKPRTDTPPLVDDSKGPTAVTDTTAAPTQQETKPRLIADPHWLRQPTADEFADAYPQRALDDGKIGAVSLSCTVTAKGDLTGCSVADETPRGWGFGAAALGLSKRFRMVPRTEDGQAVGGGTVRIPIRFAMKG